MQHFNIETKVEQFDDVRELPADEQALLEAANEALNTAYAPYSNFRVGAALQLENGIIHRGSNQENAAYPSGLCAERVAFFSSGAQYPGVAIRKIAITAGSDHFPLDHPVAPCGACRQSMLEYELNQQFPITMILRGRQGKIYRIHGISQLLPLFFHESNLRRD